MRAAASCRGDGAAGPPRCRRGPPRRPRPRCQRGSARPTRERVGERAEVARLAVVDRRDLDDWTLPAARLDQRAEVTALGVVAALRDGDLPSASVLKRRMPFWVSGTQRRVERRAARRWPRGCRARRSSGIARRSRRSPMTTSACGAAVDERGNAAGIMLPVGVDDDDRVGSAGRGSSSSASSPPATAPPLPPL